MHIKCDGSQIGFARDVETVEIRRLYGKALRLWQGPKVLNEIVRIFKDAAKGPVGD
jgi:hypothetical protein